MNRAIAFMLMMLALATCVSGCQAPRGKAYILRTGDLFELISLCQGQEFYYTRIQRTDADTDEWSARVGVDGPQSSRIELMAAALKGYAVVGALSRPREGAEYRVLAGFDPEAVNVALVGVLSDVPDGSVLWVSGVMTAADFERNRQAAVQANCP